MGMQQCIKFGFSLLLCVFAPSHPIYLVLGISPGLCACLASTLPRELHTPIHLYIEYDNIIYMYNVLWCWSLDSGCAGQVLYH